MKIIMFSGPWCAPCKIVKPILMEVKKGHPEHHIEVLDVQENMKTARNYQVMSVPTILFLNKKGEVVDQIVGLTDRDTIEEKIRGVRL